MPGLLIFGGGGIAHGIASVTPLDFKILLKSECDVTDYGQVLRAMVKYQPRYVVNCAGIDDEDEPLSTIITNLGGSMNVIDAVSGSIPVIMIASVAGMYGKPEHAAYCASKAGVISLVQSAAMEGKNAYAISPGRVDTKMREQRYPDDKPGTRLDPRQVGYLVNAIFDGLYEPGDNILLRKKGYQTVITYVDKGGGWKERLWVGHPKVL